MKVENYNNVKIVIPSVGYKLKAIEEYNLHLEEIENNELNQII